MFLSLSTWKCLPQCCTVFKNLISSLVHVSLRKYCWSKKMNTIIVLKFLKLSSKNTLISVPAHTWVLRSPVTKAGSQLFHGSWTRSWRKVPSLQSFVWILWSGHLPEKTFQSIGLLKIKIPGRNFLDTPPRGPLPPPTLLPKAPTQ